MTRKVIELNFELWDRQLEAIQSFAQERLYGGAAGGGKSHLERVESIALSLEIPGLQTYLFRRSFSDLQKSYMEGPTGYDAMLGPLVQEGAAECVAKEIRFPEKRMPDGSTRQSKIFLCHCQHEKDIYRFGSFEFHNLMIAEAGEFTPSMISYLRSRVRMPEQFLLELPEKYMLPKKYWVDPNEKEWSFPRLSMTCNPIGPGKAFLKRNFVDGHSPQSYWRAGEDDGGMLRQYIPAKLSDNPSLNPKRYASKLKGIGNAAVVQALLDGNWNVTVGAFFPQIDRNVHIIRSFSIPRHWPRFCVMDYGACGEGDPFSIGWYAISDGSIPFFSPYNSNAVISGQRDSMICYRRWNGAGLPKQDAVQIAHGIKARQAHDEDILFYAAGGDILEQRGHGESIFSLFQKEGITFRRADMRRQNGWGQVDYRLSGENGYPLSFWFEEASGDLDTMGDLQHDILNPSDIARGNDHDADRHRYACMTRPIAKDAPRVEPINYQSPKRQATPAQLIDMITNVSKKSAYVSKR